MTKTLSEWNAERRNVVTLDVHLQPTRNGLACDMCGGDLVDSAPAVLLTSWPAQKQTHCLGCDFAGFRVV